MADRRASDQQSGPVRVAMVLGSSTGGIGRHVVSLTRALGAAGYPVTVYGPEATQRQFSFTATGARAVELEIPANVDARRDVQAVAELRRALRADPPDVLHAHGLRAALISALARSDSLPPLVVTWHNQVLGGGLRAVVLRAGERYVARAATVTLGASADLVARVKSLGGRDVRLGPVAAPALGMPVRDPAQVRTELDATGRPLLLSVGRLHPQKGFHTLIEAAGRWRSMDPAPVVAIAGSGPAFIPLATQISAARAPVVLLGHRNDVADLVAAADLAVITSVWEARQLFAQEALAVGAPLIATEVGGLPDLVGEAAVLIPPDDVDALDAAVRRMLADPALRARYARAGRARAAGWPTEADTVSQIRDVYAGAIAAVATGSRRGQ